VRKRTRRDGPARILTIGTFFVFTWTLSRCRRIVNIKARPPDKPKTPKSSREEDGQGVKRSLPIVYNNGDTKTIRFGGEIVLGRWKTARYLLSANRRRATLHFLLDHSRQRISSGCRLRGVPLISQIMCNANERGGRKVSGLVWVVSTYIVFLTVCLFLVLFILFFLELFSNRQFGLSSYILYIIIWNLLNSSIIMHTTYNLHTKIKYQNFNTHIVNCISICQWIRFFSGNSLSVSRNLLKSSKHNFV
jgi:hypothetical protein